MIRRRPFTRPRKTIDDFPSLYRDKWTHMMKCKLGLFGEERRSQPDISFTGLDEKKSFRLYKYIFHLSQEGMPNGDQYQTEVSQNLACRLESTVSKKSAKH